MQGDAALETAALEVSYAGGSADTAALPGAGAKIQRIVGPDGVVVKVRTRGTSRRRTHSKVPNASGRFRKRRTR